MIQNLCKTTALIKTVPNFTVKSFSLQQKSNFAKHVLKHNQKRFFSGAISPTKTLWTREGFLDLGPSFEGRTISKFTIKTNL